MSKNSEIPKELLPLSQEGGVEHVFQRILHRPWTSIVWMLQNDPEDFEPALSAFTYRNREYSANVARIYKYCLTYRQVAYE